jgi:formamidopyrimidine-DNA glycosylase
MRRSAMHPHGDLKSQRLGKRLFVEFGDGPWLLLHLGKEGQLY